MIKFLKNVGLFFASPFIALAYVIALPFVGIYYITNFAVEAGMKKASETAVEQVPTSITTKTV